MNKQEHLLVQAMEECAELAHRLSKILRFHGGEVQPSERENPDGYSNWERAQHEFDDLIVVMQMLGFNPAVRSIVYDAKETKIEKHRLLSEKMGTLRPIDWPLRTCEEITAVGNLEVPCGKPAMVLVKHDGRREGPYFMCRPCASHNVANRGASVLEIHPTIEKEPL